MKINDQLAAYLSGGKSEKELDDMTTMLVQDYYQEKDTKEKWTKILSDEYGVKSFQDLADLTQLSGRGKNTRKFIVGTILAIAAVGFLLVGVFFKYEAEPILSVENVLKEYYNSPVQFRNTKGIESKSDIRHEAFTAYNLKEYRTATEIFNEIIDENTIVEDDYFYLGLSYLYNKESFKAANTFRKLLDQDNLQRRDAITWFLALALIENEQFVEAKLYLEEVSSWKGNSGKMIKAGQAKVLLQMLE